MMSEKLFEKGCDENVCSFDYSTLDTYYEYNVSNEEIIEWNKHSSNDEYTDLERITEILNIKQMRLESLMNHREEIGKLFDKINEQQDTISQLEEKNDKLIQKNCIPCELVNLQTREIDKLKEENERLNKELLRIKKTVSSIQKEINNYYNEVCSNE